MIFISARSAVTSSMGFSQESDDDLSRFLVKVVDLELHELHNNFKPNMPDVSCQGVSTVYANLSVYIVIVEAGDNVKKPIASLNWEHKTAILKISDNTDSPDSDSVTTVDTAEVISWNSSRPVCLPAGDPGRFSLRVSLYERDLSSIPAAVDMLGGLRSSNRLVAQSDTPLRDLLSKSVSVSLNLFELNKSGKPRSTICCDSNVVYSLFPFSACCSSTKSKHTNARDYKSIDDQEIDLCAPIVQKLSVGTVRICVTPWLARRRPSAHDVPHTDAPDDLSILSNPNVGSYLEQNSSYDHHQASADCTRKFSSQFREVLFIRHAESVWNRAQSRLDVSTMLSSVDHPLSLPVGRSQAESLGAAIAENLQPIFSCVSDVYVSPLTRALETAAIALKVNFASA
jgi:hypothetical protein